MPAYVPTNYVLFEGDEWKPITNGKIPEFQFSALMFSDGSIWDNISGKWRNDLDRPSPIPETPAPAPVGRPSLYKPEYCDSVIEWGKQGKSKAWMCGELDIARPTLDLWIATHQEFSYAMDKALHKSQQWWEQAGQDGMTAQQFSAPIWSRSMSARFPADWREKTDNTTTHNLGDGVAELFGLISGKTRSL